MPNHLHAVTSEDVALNDMGPHPALQDAAIYTDVYHQEGAEYTTYSVTFGQTFKAPDVVSFLSAPMRSIVPNFSDTDVRRGLRSLTYPNGRVMKQAKAIDPEARSRILGQRSEILGLLDIIDHPRHHQMIPARVHVLGAYLAELVAEEDLTNMKPSEISKLCDAYDIPYDEMHVWKLKGGNRTNHTVRLDDLGIEPSLLKNALIKDRYKPKTVIPTGEAALVPKRELPSAAWAQGPGYIELLRRLPRISGDDIDRWDVLLRREDTPRHVVRPQIAWTTEVTSHHDGIDWKEVHTRFLTDYQPPEYDVRSNTFVHTSPLLGAVMLAGQVPKSEWGVFREQVGALRLRKDHVYHDRPAYNPKVAGIFPALIQSEAITATIMATRAFRNLQQHVIDADIN